MPEGRHCVAICFFLLLSSVSVLAQTFQNPIRKSGPDPFMVFYQGYYYLTYTSSYHLHPSGSAIEIVKAASLADIRSTEARVVWHDEANAGRSANMWAPELHRLNGPHGMRWYLYYTAGPQTCCEGQRVHVLESEADDPMGPYHYMNQLTPEYALDGSVLTVGTQLYFVYARADRGNHIYIAAMENPFTLQGSGIHISSPQYPWEKIAGIVNEAPNALIRNGKIFLTYSFNDCSSGSYGLSMLTASITADLLNPASWIKSNRPLMQSSVTNHVFGPGHNGFFKSPDGKEDWIVYHANDHETDGCGDNRSPRVQKVRWNIDGTPNLDAPVSVKTSIALPGGDPGNAIEAESTVDINTAESLLTYPIPVSDILHFEFTAGITEHLHLQIYDMRGLLVSNLYNDEVEKAITIYGELDMTTLPEGLYTLRVIRSATVTSQKLLVRHK